MVGTHPCVGAGAPELLNLYVLSGLSWVLGHRGPPHQFKVQFPAWNHSLEASAQNPALPSALGLTRLVSVCPALCALRGDPPGVRGECEGRPAIRHLGRPSDEAPGLPGSPESGLRAEVPGAWAAAHRGGHPRGQPPATQHSPSRLRAPPRTAAPFRGAGVPQRTLSSKEQVCNRSGLTSDGRRHSGHFCL